MTLNIKQQGFVLLLVICIYGRGKVIVLLSADYGSVDNDVFKAKMQKAKDAGVAIYITGFTNNPEEYSNLKLLLEGGYGRLLTATGSNVYDVALGEIKNDFELFLNNQKDPENGIPTLLADIKGRFAINTLAAGSTNTIVKIDKNVNGFDFNKHTYTFANFANGAYGLPGGHCAGFALSSEMAFLGILPAKVRVSDLERKLDNESNDFSFNGNDIAYDLYTGGELYM